MNPSVPQLGLTTSTVVWMTVGQRPQEGEKQHLLASGLLTVQQADAARGGQRQQHTGGPPKQAEDPDGWARAHDDLAILEEGQPRTG